MRDIRREIKNLPPKNALPGGEGATKKLSAQELMQQAMAPPSFAPLIRMNSRYTILTVCDYSSSPVSACDEQNIMHYSSSPDKGATNKTLPIKFDKIKHASSSYLRNMQMRGGVLFCPFLHKSLYGHYVKPSHHPIFALYGVGPKNTQQNIDGQGGIHLFEFTENEARILTKFNVSCKPAFIVKNMQNILSSKGHMLFIDPKIFVFHYYEYFSLYMEFFPLERALNAGFYKNILNAAKMNEHLYVQSVAAGLRKIELATDSNNNLKSFLRDRVKIRDFRRQALFVAGAPTREEKIRKLTTLILTNHPTKDWHQTDLLAECQKIV